MLSRSGRNALRQAEIGSAGSMAGVAAVIVAAGRGARAGADMPKQFRPIGGAPMVRRSLAMFLEHPDVGPVQPVIHQNDVEMFRSSAQGLAILPPVFGGATRQASVRAGLEALAPHAPEIVLVHDAARPFASAALASRAIDAARKSGAAIPALPMTDTVKTVDANDRVTATLERASLRTVQTPQAFAFDALLAAHRKAAAAGREDFTDDAALAEWAGLTVTIFAGEPSNIKITTPEDFARAQPAPFAAEFTALGDVRTGTGIDVHAFGPGDHVTLGGIRIPHSQALTGHSDADVVLHALTDAILGALADGDIGVHFPPSDPQWRGASSDRFVAFALERLAARGGRIGHIDVNIVCEAPRIGPHRDAIRGNIARLAAIDISRVAVKATTSEKLGFTGRGEGIVAYVTATVRLPWG